MTPEGQPKKFNIGTLWHTQDAFEEAMRYQSPIEIIQGELETKIENDIMTAVQHYGIRVDKEELIKALQYDRHQYEQGYEDAKQDYMKPSAKWEITSYGTGALGITYSNKRCTNCGFTHMLECRLNYCPNCGAIMSLPEEEEDE